jgi:hypothetical protein
VVRSSHSNRIVREALFAAQGFFDNFDLNPGNMIAIAQELCGAYIKHILSLIQRLWHALPKLSLFGFENGSL